MGSKRIEIFYDSYHLDDIVDEDLRSQILSTIAFADNAYAPYSKFKVSAIIRLENGLLVKGANVENASYPVSNCAERNVLSHVTTNYPKEIITSICIYADINLKKPVPPCGLCRQTLLEIENRQDSPIKIYLVTKSKKIVEFNQAKDLLPFSFDATFLAE